MIRFRHTEDEKRYLALLSAVYVRIGRHLPPAVASEVMRNLGKLQTLLLLEGVTQGAASEAIASKRGCGDGALAQLSDAYGSCDTPLVDIERRLADDLGLSSDDCRVIGAGPLQFAPEAWKADDEPTPPVTDSSGITWHQNLPPDVAEGLKQGSDTDRFEPLSESGEGLPADAAPALLDRVRDHILALKTDGWDPSSWQDLILKLHVDMKLDAYFLDLQLSSEMGRTVLDQCGVHIAIPPAINVDDLPSPSE